MFELINSFVLWWHWIVIGIVLIIAEIFIPTFITLWLGSVAIIIGCLDYFFKLTFQIELLLLIVLSIFLTLLWFKFIKVKTKTHSGQSNNDFDIKGVVLEDILVGSKGKVHFDKPLLGDTDWFAISDSDIQKGKRIKIVDIIGELIKVGEE